MSRKQILSLSLLLITLGSGALLLFYSLAQSDLTFRFGGQISLLMIGIGILFLVLPPQSSEKVSLEKVLRNQPGWWKAVWIIVLGGLLFSTGRLIDIFYQL